MSNDPVQRHSARAVFQTASASKYLQQLCKHFAHKVPATWDETAGQVTLPVGSLRLSADPAALHIHCAAEDEARLATTCKVLEDHLIRFAFRDKLTALDWQNETSDAGA